MAKDVNDACEKFLRSRHMGTVSMRERLAKEAAAKSRPKRRPRRCAIDQAAEQIEREQK